MSDAIEVAAEAARELGRLNPEEFAALMELANALRKMNS
jgi:hypothetical protein